MTSLAPVWVWAVASITCFTLARLFCIRRVRDYIESQIARFTTTAPDVQSFRALVPLIEKVIRFKEQPEDPTIMTSGIDMEKTLRLDAELHKLDMPHPDFKPDDNRIIQATISIGLLSCTNRSDLRGARILFQRTGDGIPCDWEPQF